MREKDTWSQISSTRLDMFFQGYFGCATILTYTANPFDYLLLIMGEKDTWSILSHRDVGWWGQLSIFFMDMIVTFLWHLSPLKSAYLWNMLIILEPACVNKGAGPLICKLSQNPHLHTTDLRKLASEFLGYRHKSFPKVLFMLLVVCIYISRNESIRTTISNSSHRNIWNSNERFFRYSFGGFLKHGL